MPHWFEVTIERLSVDDDVPYYDLYEGNQNHIVKNLIIKNKSELKRLLKQLNIQ